MANPSDGFDLVESLRTRGLRIRLRRDGTPVVAGEPDECDRYLLATHRESVIAALLEEQNRCA